MMADENVASKTSTAKSLGALTRSTVNRSVKRQHIDSLQLPQLLKDECFENVARDRTNESIPARKSLVPCECCYFRAEDYEIHVPEWGKFFVPRYALHLTYKPTLPWLSTDAEWIKLPERESLLREYESEEHGPSKKDLEACLNTLRFHPSTGLGKAHEWIRRYIYYQNEHDWYHLSICVKDMVRFVEEMKNFELVVLPYGCVSDGGVGFEGNEPIRWRSHRRQMIVVVKYDQRESFRKAMHEIGVSDPCNLRDNNFYCIRCVATFVKTIAFVSQPHENGETKHYVIFQPVLRHAVWWMLLLVPQGTLEKFARKTMYENGIDETTEETTGEGRRVYASTELGIENCVVRFDPLHQCIGDPVDDLKGHIYRNLPFVYWLGGKVLSLTETRDAPSNAIFSDRQFVRWCVSREMNTLLNLNGDGWIDYSVKRRRRYEALKYDEYLYYNFESDESEDDFDLYYQTRIR